MELREQLELLKEQNTRQDRERFPSFGEDSFVSGSSHEEIQHLKTIIDKLQAEKKALTKKVCRIENLTVMIIMTNIYNAASSCYCFPCYIFCLALHFLFEFVHTRNTKAVNTHKIQTVQILIPVLSLQMSLVKYPYPECFAARAVQKSKIHVIYKHFKISNVILLHHM